MTNDKDNASSSVGAQQPNLVDLLRSSNGEYGKCIADTLINNSQSYSIEDVVGVLKEKGYWSHLVMMWVRRSRPIDQSDELIGQYIQFSPDEKKNLSKVALDWKESILAFHLALSFRDQGLIRRVVKNVIGFKDNKTQGDVTPYLQIALDYGTEDQFYNLIDKINSIDEVALYRFLRKQIDDSQRLDHLIVGLVEKLSRSYSGEQAFNLAMIAKNKQALLKAFSLSESKNFGICEEIEILKVGLNLISNYDLSIGEGREVRERMGRILNSIKFNWGTHDYMEEDTPFRKVVFKAAQESSNYSPLKEYIYTRLGYGDISSALLVKNGLPLLDLDRGRLIKAVSECLSYACYPISRAIQIGETFGVPLDKKQVREKITELFPEIDIEHIDKAREVVAGFKYLQQHEGLSSLETQMFNYANNLIPKATEKSLLPTRTKQ